MIKILYCDIDPAMLEALKLSLEPYDFSVDTLEQPQEAAAVLEKTRYDVFLCGAWLRNVDGYALCSMLRNSPHANLGSLAILVLAAEPPGFAEFQFLPQKKIYYLIKYKSPDQVAEKIRAILPRPQLREERGAA